MVSLNCHTADEKVPIHWYPIISTPLSDPSWVKWLGYDWSDPVLRCSRCCGHPGRHRRQHPTPGRRLLREGHPDAPGILSLLQHHQALQLSWSRQRGFLGLYPWNKVFHHIESDSFTHEKLYQVHFHGLGGSGPWLQYVSKWTNILLKLVGKLKP